MRAVEEKLEALYEKYGGKAIYPPLFAFFFFLHLVTSLGIYYPSADPNELSIVAVGEWFIGKNWSGVMCSVDNYYGFVQGLLYAPVLLIFNDAHLQYTAMLSINALLVSIVPLIAFSCAARLGAGKIWKELLIAIVAGGYCCYFAHTKFAWSETSAILLPWLLLWLLLRAEDVRSKAGRVFFALLCGFCCALSLGAHSRLIAVVLAVLAALIAQRVFYKKSAVPILPFVISFIIFGTLEMTFSHFIQRSLWLHSDPELLNNTAENFITHIGSGFAAENGVKNFFLTLFGQLYYFVTATWGAGAAALCLFAAACARCVKAKRSGGEQENSSSMTGFAFFTSFSVIFTVLIGTFYCFDGESLAAYRDTALFGRFLDGVIPFALMFAIITLFTRSIDLKDMLGTSALLGTVYLAFFSVTLTFMPDGGEARISQILALYPLLASFDGNSLLKFESLFLSSSITFCVIALIIVIVSCAKKTRPVIISMIFLGLTVCSSLFIQIGYLPVCRGESYMKNEYIVDLSKSVYDQNGAPTLTAYNLSRHEALMLQFLDQNVTVRITYDIETVPENCFLAVRSGEDVSALLDDMVPFLLVADNGKLRLYAYGERAIAYMRSQDKDENEDESVPLITEKTVPQPSDTTPEPPAATTASTTPPETERTTERTPIISTHTTPAVVTVPADELATDDEWAIIE